MNFRHGDCSTWWKVSLECFPSQPREGFCARRRVCARRRACSGKLRARFGHGPNDWDQVPSCSMTRSTHRFGSLWAVPLLPRPRLAGRASTVPGRGSSSPSSVRRPRLGTTVPAWCTISVSPQAMQGAPPCTGCVSSCASDWANHAVRACERKRRLDDEWKSCLRPENDLLAHCTVEAAGHDSELLGACTCVPYPCGDCMDACAAGSASTCHRGNLVDRALIVWICSSVAMSRVRLQQ